jgi:hypothetical protein
MYFFTVDELFLPRLASTAVQFSSTSVSPGRRASAEQRDFRSDNCASIGCDWFFLAGPHRYALGHTLGIHSSGKFSAQIIRVVLRLPG